MQRFAILAAVASVLYVVAVAADEQQMIRKCSCDEQQQMMNKMEKMFTECQNKMMQDAQPDMKKMTQQDDQKMTYMKDCFGQQTHTMHEMMKCTNRKMADKDSCTKDKSDKQQMEKENSSRKMAEWYQRMFDQMAKKLEQTMQKAGGAQTNTFARVYTKQMTERMNKCFTEKAQQMDMAQQFNCECKFEDEQMKQTMMDECFNGEEFKKMVENVCQCSQKQQAQGAQEFCQRFDEEKTQMARDFFMKNQQ